MFHVCNEMLKDCSLLWTVSDFWNNWTYHISFGSPCNEQNTSNVPRLQFEKEKWKACHSTALTPSISYDSLHPNPKAILARRLVKKGNAKVLVQWQGAPEESDVAWENYRSLEEIFPSINLEDKVCLKGMDRYLSTLHAPCKRFESHLLRGSRIIGVWRLGDFLSE